MPSLESATLTVWVRTGSRFEEKRISGISHFLEHMVFKGSENYPSAKEIFELIDSLGAENNAGTSKEWTNFYIKARVGVMDIAIDLLSDVVLRPLLDAKEIERERGVILEEIAMIEDTPLHKIGDIFDNLTFSGTALGRDIIGTREIIKTIKRNDFVKYRNLHYYPKNMLITVAGGVNTNKMITLCEKYFAHYKAEKKPVNVPAIYKQTKPRVLLKNKMTDQAHLILGYLGNEMGNRDRYVEAILSTILGGGASSRMFTEVREKRGLAYAVRTSSDHYLDTGSLATYAGVPIKKAEEAISVILFEYNKIKEGKIKDSELKKAKEYLKGHLALSLEDTNDVNGFFGLEQLLLGRVRTPEEVYSEIDGVKGEDVVRVAKYMLKPDRLNLAVIGPYKSQETFEKLLS
jgi:predicted Zn-dependent peptidase